MHAVAEPLPTKSRRAKVVVTALDPHSRAWVLAATAACLLPLLLQLPARMGLGIAIVGAVVMALSWRLRVPGWLRLLLAVAALG